MSGYGRYRDINGRIYFKEEDAFPGHFTPSSRRSHSSRYDSSRSIQKNGDPGKDFPMPRETAIKHIVVATLIFGMIAAAGLATGLIVYFTSNTDSPGISTTPEATTAPITEPPVTTTAELSITTGVPPAPTTTSTSTASPTTEPATVAPTTTIPEPTTLHIAEPTTTAIAEPTTTTPEPSTAQPTTTVVATTEDVITTTIDPPTTTAEPTTSKPPEVTITPTGVTLTFENIFTNTDQMETFNVFVGQISNATLDDSATWASAQNSDDTDIAYVTIQCDNIFDNSDCSGDSTRRRKRQVVESVTIQIGVDICDEAIDEICNGPLLEGTTYFFVLQRVLDGSIENITFPISITTATYGDWDNWGDWGDCDQGCGGGIQRRFRDCDSDFCKGSNSSSQKCNTDYCEITAEAGIWFSWTDWSLCTQTCGDTGRRIRTRSCDRGDDDLDCVGESTEITDCNAYPCPDCDIECTPGSPSASCTHCSCEGQHSGVVRSTDGLPLNDVDIVITEAPYDVLTTTPADGSFSLNTVCVAHYLTWKKEGYVSQTYRGEWIPDDIILTKLETLMITVHPESKNRLVGENVTFCCSATSVAQQYEWFRNDVPRVEAGNTTLLTLLNITTDDVGFYRCRASTESQGVYSSEATLTVRNNPDDFCQNSVITKYEQLPYGCENTSVDIGGCENLRCRGDSDISSTETCSETATFCCTAKEFEKHIIQCNGFNYTVYKTVSCGCSECTSPIVSVRGFVRERVETDRNTERVPDVDVYISSSNVATSGLFGQYSIDLPSGTLRAVIVAKSPDNSLYADAVKVLTFNEQATGEYRRDIILPRVLELQTINPKVEWTMELNIITGIDPLTIIVPANSVYNSSGNIAQDPLKQYASVLDPSNVFNMEDAPGDFKSVDEYGETQLLGTFGMLYVTLETMDESSIYFLENTPIEIQLPYDLLGTVADESALKQIKLFSLNTESGFWEEVADIENNATNYKTSVSAGLLFSRWINIGQKASDICYSKIRSFENNDYSEDKQVEVSNVYAHIKANHGAYFLSSTEDVNDDQTNGYCLAHPCTTTETLDDQLTYTGTLFVKTGLEYLVPANNDVGLSNDLRTSLDYEVSTERLNVSLNLTAVSNTGPFYDTYRKWQYSPDCITAPFTDNHFRFHLEEGTVCARSQEFHFANKLTGTCQPFYYKSWYTAKEIDSAEYTTCYMKVRIAHFTTGNLKAQAVSAVGSMKYRSSLDEINLGDTYGFHKDCPSGRVVCLKVKPPGSRQCSTDESHNKEDDFTLISVTALVEETNEYLSVSGVSGSLDEENQVLQNDTVFVFKADMELSQLTGIYCETKNSVTASDVESTVKCFSSASDEYVVKFGDSIECRLDLILFLENMNETTNYTSNFTSWLSQIGRNVFIDDNYIHLTLTIFNETQLHQFEPSDNEMFEDILYNYTSDYKIPDSIGAAYNYSITPTSPYKIVVFFWTGSFTVDDLIIADGTEVYSVAPSNSSLTPDQREAINNLTTNQTRFSVDEHTPQDFIQELRTWCPN